MKSFQNSIAPGKYSEKQSSLYFKNAKIEQKLQDNKTGGNN